MDEPVTAPGRALTSDLDADERSAALVAAVRSRFDTTDEIVSALSSPDLEAATSQERVRDWRQHRSEASRRVVEHIVPRILRPITRTPPGYVGRAADGRDAEALRAEVDRLGPWRLPFPLAHGIATTEGPTADVATARMQYRRDLIAGTVADLLGDDLATADVIDIGCQTGYFSMDLAERGAASVLGIDLRPGNLAQARFLAEHHGVERVRFEQGDVDELVVDRQYDVVLNLGLLYHVTRPLDLLKTTYELTRGVAVVDTVCSTEPVAAFLLLSDKDVDMPGEGRDVVELHPTYRAVVEGLRFAGFRHVFEVQGLTDRPHRNYRLGGRRCFLAIP